MDGKLLVLCGDRPTINEWGERIDENGNLLHQTPDNQFMDIEGNTVEVDIHKKVINGMDLLNDMMTESTESDIIFVDWNTIVPSNIEQLQKMVEYAASTELIPPQIILSNEKDRSLMKKAHIDRLLSVDKSGERPSIDYKFKAMDDFLILFSECISKNGIVTILPAFPTQEEIEINRARIRIMQTWKDRNEMESKYGNDSVVEVLEPMNYEEFGQVYIKAHDEMLRILSKPDWYEGKPISYKELEERD